MTIALTILEPVEVPEEIDAFERTTWARLRWDVGARVATRHVRDDSVRDTIAVPTAPVATWLAENWWSLLYEPTPINDDPAVAPPMVSEVAASLWRHRHSVRSADSSLRLPDLRFFSSGRALSWALAPDLADPPLRFLEAGNGVLGKDAFIEAAADFIGWTLGHLRDCDDPRAAWLRERWDAIRGSSRHSDEAEFCRAAGRLGLDPYAVADWPSGIAAFFEAQPPGALDRSFAVDYLASGSDIVALPSVAAALQSVVDDEGLGARDVPVQLHDGLEQAADVPPYARGYQRAERLRRDAGLNGDLRRIDQAALVQKAGTIVLTSTTRALPGAVASVAGWRRGGLHVVGRHHHKRQEAASRFALARGVYLALWCAEDGPRLAVDATLDDHQAARAFAAELLAPRRAVARAVEAEARSMPWGDAVARVAGVLGVDVLVVVRQVENARAGR